MATRSTVTCVALGCKNLLTPENKAAGISFHRFPKDPELRKNWAVRLHRDNWAPTDYSRICSTHFEDVCLYNSGMRKKLLPGAEPTLFNVPAHLQQKTLLVRRVLERTSHDVEHCASAAAAKLSGTSSADRSQPTSSKTPITGEKCEIPFKTTERSEHFMNIAETLMKYQENDFLCDAVLVSKCGRELKAHSVLLAAVSPVFLMAIEEKPSSGPYHLCFPEVEFDVLEIVVHFVYTGKLVLPTVYSQMDQLSNLFKKLSDLGLSLHKLHECEMTFVRNTQQPPNSSITVKEEDEDSKTSLEDSVQELQASCEWPLDKKPSSVEAFSEMIIADVSPNDARRSQTRGDSEEDSKSTLARQGNRYQEQQKVTYRKTVNKNGKIEIMPSYALVRMGTVVTKPVVRPPLSILRSLLGELNTPAAAIHSNGTGSRELKNLPVGLVLHQNVGRINTLHSDNYCVHEAIVNDNGEPNPKTKGDILNLVDPLPTEATLGPSGVEELADKANSSSSHSLTCEHCTEPNGKTFATELDLLWHKIKSHWDHCNVCDYCGRRFSLRKNLKYHIKRHLGIHPKKNHKCNDCGLHFLSPYHLKVHRVQHTGEKPYECPDCKKHFALQVNMERHQLLHTGYRPFLCDFCGKGFTQKPGLTNHLTVCHDFECALCSCKQTSKADMEKHALEVHQLSQVVKFNSIVKNRGTYLCEMCGKNCISASSLRFHIKGHSKKPLHCKTFGNTSSKSHRLLHTGERPFVCDVCQEGFTRRSTLMMHLTTHSGIKLYDCVICSKSFASQCQVKLHIQKHMKQDMTRSNQKRFKCGICNNQFTSKAYLIIHNRIHTGERPYKCKFCSKQFRLGGTLTVHIRTHTGDKPFSCTVCEMSFTQSHHLICHMRWHTGEKPFVCKICSKSYKQKIDLRYHLMRFHKIDVASKSLSENIEIDGKVKVSDAPDTNVIVEELKHELEN